MKTNLPKTAIVVLILALLGSVWLSRCAARDRSSIVQPARRTAAGFGKFMSQLSWIRLTQLRGAGSAQEKDVAAMLQRRFETITDLDPLFADAYEQGAMDIAHAAPEDALRLLDKALAVEKLRNWKIPVTAGFIAMRQLKSADRAAAYLEKAVRLPDCPSYAHRMLIYAKAQQVDNEPFAVLNLWTDYLGARERTGPGELGAMPFLAGAGEMRSGEDRERVLARVSELSQQVIADSQAQLAKESDPARKTELQTRIEQTQNIIGLVYGGQHICAKCFRKYAAGDRFCAHDGTEVAPYGVCPAGHVMHGSFCHLCGRAAK